MHTVVCKLDGVVQEQNRPRNEQRKFGILNGYTYGGKNLSNICRLMQLEL